MSSRATNDVTLTTRPDGSLLASGPNAKLTSYVVTVDTTAQNITALKIEALPDPALPRGGPGRDAYGHFRVTGLHVEAAPAAANGADAAQVVAVAIKAIKVDDSAYPFEAGDLLQSDRGRRAAKADRGPSTRCGIPSNACRDRLCSPLRRRSATPAAPGSR